MPKSAVHSKLFFLIFCLGILSPLGSVSEELPRGSTDNCLYIMPIFERIRVPGSLSYQEKLEQILKMKRQLGYGNLYHRLGFSFIYDPNSDAEVRQSCTLAQETGIHLGLIFALQSHTRDDFRAVADKDLRLYQWRKDGVDWKGSFTSTGTVEVPEDQRDYKIPTPSRYAIPLREYNAAQATKWSESAKKLMDDFPGVVTCVNGPIEEELAIGGMNSQDKLADYSPFAITEFRDWLRHSGLYDASSGKFAGEGASKLLIGDLIDFNGTVRSQFYDDPTPEENNGTGISFNQFFGTNFKTWSLRYWDLNIYPDAITDEYFDCTPEAGTGFCAGGFDAPRLLDGNSKFWRTWSYDIPDQGGIYPAGNPAIPAYGFRQNLTRNFVRDLFEVVASSGIPRQIMYAHQIPGETLGNFTGEGPRNRSSASTVWSGYLEKSKNVGITRFGDINPALMTQYADDWGIFEWHTSPNADPDNQALYTISLNALNNYYQHKVHALFPGWWGKEAPDNNSIFPLNDSKFADAIKDFMLARAEVPYHLQGAAHDYSPPRVTGITGFIDENKLLNVKWNVRIWEDLVQKWVDWAQLAGFEVQMSNDGTNWSASEQTALPVFSKSVTTATIRLRVRATSKKGLPGEWSNIITVGSQPDGAPLTIIPEFSSLYADPQMNNKITVTAGDPLRKLEPASLKITISGEGGINNTMPANVNSIEKFWPLNSLAEITGVYRLENIMCKDGLLSASVSPVTPIDPYFSLTGSSLNGAQLPYISFRLYSDIPSNGQLYWFAGSQVKSVPFVLNKGWNVYSFSNLPDWISQSLINAVRLDPGTTASAKIMVDWFAIGSQPVSTAIESSFLINGNQATILTTPTGNPGNYTVTATINKLTASTTVQTLGTNQKPEVSILYPVKDTTIILGSGIVLKAAASDSDGRVSFINYLANNAVIQKSALSPYSFTWMPTAAGSYQLSAEAFDNANETSRSAIRNIAVTESKPFSGVNGVVPGTVEAEDFDTGGEKIAFHDTDLLNKGGVYRSESVDILKKSDNTHGYFISWTEAGEWLTYTIDVKKGAKMDFNLLISAKTGGGEIHLELNGKPLTNHQVVSPTGDDQQFKTVSFKDIYLQPGVQKLKVVIDKGGIGIDYLEIVERVVTSVGELLMVPRNFLYPNPAHDQVTINGNANSKMAVRIVSLNGQVVRLYQLTPENCRISVSGLPKGNYIVWVISEGKIFKDKLIKL